MVSLIEEKQGKTFNYGNEAKPINAAILGAKINQVEAKREEYNKALTVLGSISNEYDALEDELGEMNKSILSSAVGLFGDDSNEYEQLGGTRASDRKRPGKGDDSQDKKPE